ncbi:uncharacterized protein N7483_004885 [Penicillium malachiteum]|uniref:uncharacterized protein n=1 Tax=Penicillium malachiteum TaxID=1324776 RepID=UPI002548A23E|nr:uncharacterized protein N7483_004885 [Penicillium malachiteum]KAJ5730377.1 hypothetical protein N7483_004885 [Penicillium malachiteum]
MATASARAQKPVGSAAWIAAEKENMADLVEQEMEEVEYPVRHEMDWLNEHMADIFSKGHTNFTDVFKTPGKMRGKTPRTARKRNVEENRVPLSEIFSSAQKQVENKPSPSPFVHRVISKTANAAPASPRPKGAEKGQPQYPDLTQNLNSFQKYNTDSGYHGMEDDDEVALPDTQPDTQVSTQPMEVDEPAALDSQDDVLMSQPTPTAEDSFHSAQENVRARGETIEPVNIDPTPTNEQTATPTKRTSKEAVSKPDSEPEFASTPTSKTKPQTKAMNKQKQIKKPAASPEPEPQYESPAKPESSPERPATIQRSMSQDYEDQTMDVDEKSKDEDTVLDNFDDIGSPSDNSTPERLPVRKSSLSFASLPAREPLTKSIGGSRISRTSHIDLPRLNSGGRLSYLGRQTGSQKITQVASEENARSSNSMAVDDEKDAIDNLDAEQATKMHSTKFTQSLHDRISMLGKAQPSRAKKSIAASAVGSANQVAYPELPTTAKSDNNTEQSGPKTRQTPPTSDPTAAEDDWIPQRPNLQKSRTADVMENLSSSTGAAETKKISPAAQEQHLTEPERPKSSYSIFSSPRPQDHQQSASASNIHADVSTTPTGSPRRYDGPLSASKMRLQSIMKSAKGLFTSTGSSARVELSSPEQPRVQPKERASAENDDAEADSRRPKSRQMLSPPRQEGRRTRSSTERAEKQRRKELEEEQQCEEEKAREQERQRAIQLKAAQDKSSVEPEERTSYKTSQSLRQPSREPESTQDSSRIAMSQSKQNDRRPKPTREPMQKPKPQPVSVRVGSTLSRGMTMNSANVQDAPPPSASKPNILKKKASNNSLHTASSASSFKSSVSSQTQAQRKAQLASERKREQEERKREQEERKREQEEREARRKEELRREQEQRRALQVQQQEEARRQAESRAEAERERRAQSVQDDSKKAANKQAIENWRMENARRQEPGSARPASRLGSMQPFGRSINPPVANPAKPPKRVLDDDAGHRATVAKPSNVQPSGEAKRRKTEDEHNPMQPVRPAMARPIRQPSTTIRKPSLFGQSSMQSGSSMLKAGQPQRPGPSHPIDMSKLAHGKIPFAEPNHAPPPAAHRAPAPASTHRTPGPAKPSPKYPNGENIHLPEIATDSEDEDDSDSEMFPVPKWAQPKELEGLLRQQDGMEVDSIFGPIAPFSLEETFKADKKIKKFRERTSSANWSGPDGLTQEEIRRDVADRQRLRLNGGWSFNP